MSPASSGSARAATLMPYDVLTMHAISAGEALINFATSSRVRAMVSNSSASVMRYGSARRALNSAIARTVRAGSGPVDALLR